jgi:hypothetical protein
MDNAMTESFDGSFRDKCLNVNWFLSIEDAREKIEIWRFETPPLSILYYREGIGGKCLGAFLFFKLRIKLELTSVIPMYIKIV